MYFLLKIVIFHCYVSLPEGTYGTCYVSGKTPASLGDYIVPPIPPFYVGTEKQSIDDAFYQRGNFSTDLFWKDLPFWCLFCPGCSYVMTTSFWDCVNGRVMTPLFLFSGRVGWPAITMTIHDFSKPLLAGNHVGGLDWTNWILISCSGKVHLSWISNSGCKYCVLTNLCSHPAELIESPRDLKQKMSWADCIKKGTRLRVVPML